MTTALDDIRRFRMVQRELSSIAALKKAIMDADGIILVMPRDYPVFIEPTRSPEAQRMIDRLDEFKRELLESMGFPQ